MPVRIPLLIGGPIGVGKTAFALRLADNLCADFPDGQLYADLDASEPDQSCDDVICGFLRALEVPAALMPDDPAQRAGLYRSLLAQQRLLVLLENARDESQVRPLLGRAAHSQIMVTSRARLLGLDGAHRIELDTFTRQESITLISRIVGAERVQAEYEAVDEIAELCGDLPLAVSIAARRIAARPEWTIAYTAGQLADRDRLMESLSVGDVNVADRLAAAYQGLPPSCREALHQLAAGGAGWTTAIGLAAALGIAVHAADALLESLVDSGLLTRAGVAGRYCVSALVTVFATDVRRDASRRSVPLVARHGRSAQGAPRQPAGLAAPGS